MKKIGILGSGVVGRTLADGFIKHGYEVKIGTRDESKLEDWLKEAGNKGSTGSFEAAADFGQIVVLAVKGHAASDVLKMAGQGIDGKVVIDATNPIDEKAGPVNGVLQFFTDINRSLMEDLQESHSDSHFVKCFSSVGAHLMVNPEIGGGQKPTMFIAGNDDSAKQEVTTILDQFGWETEDMGKAEAARAIEPLCMLWCIPGFKDNKWSHAFKLLR
ncbi:NADPH-dependent F420 reductase [Ekhidna sp.]|uniref:NADPH-dependent F420 reductase n=1 Tax=Ekhidna sp. TaxID=2608089 RepID=UPI003CCC101E